MSEELPWERACDTDERYAAWSAWAATGAGAPPRGPWRKLGAPALALLRRALAPDAERRAPLAALLELPWSREPVGECPAAPLPHCPTAPLLAQYSTARGRVRY